MEYEVVECKSKIVAGIGIRTNNNDPAMYENIGALWQKFFMEGVYASIPNKADNHTIGLYHNYESDFKGDYDMNVCCEVNDEKNIPDGLQMVKIPKGKYAKFNLKGNMNTIVGQFWQELWCMNLERAYTYDYEEYLNSDPENSEINVYIALK